MDKVFIMHSSESERARLAGVFPLPGYDLGVTLFTTGKEDLPSAASWSLFAVAGLAVAMSPLNSTLIAVALPAIGKDFGVGSATLTSWLINGFLVTSVVCLAPAGKLADIFGLGRVLLAGQFVLLAGTVIAATAPTFWALVGGRMLMAVATAMLNPTGMALVRNHVPATMQPRAFGFVSASNSVAASVGPPIAGLLTAQWGWRAAFLLNLPLLLVSWGCQLRDRQLNAPAQGRQGPRPRFDWPGGLLLMASLLLLIAAMQLRNAMAAVLLVAGLALSVAFVLWERRAAAPVVDFTLFRRAGFAAGVATLAAQFFGMYGLIFLTPFLFTQVAGFGPADVGFVIAVFAVLVIVVAPLAGWLSERVGSRPTVIVGALIGATGLAMLNFEAVWGMFPLIATGFALTGLGYGLSVGPIQAAALGAVGRHESGAASAALGTLRYVGGIAGISLLTALMANAAPGAAVAGERIALWLFAAIFAFSSVIAMALPRLNQE